ncbi:MAG: hypothetical protein AAF637_15115, partial [Pseudomonadota bacterium]
MGAAKGEAGLEFTERPARQRDISSWLPLFAFAFGVLFVVFSLGFAAGVYQLPPYALYRTAVGGIKDLRE